MPSARKKPRLPLKKKIEAIAGYFERSPITIKQWIAEGMDPYDPDSIIQWWEWKSSRARNKPNHERPARHYRPPI